MPKKHIILELIEKGEGQHLDFKFEISDAAKIARSLCAFANTGGGQLLIGVRDDGSISGAKSAEEIYMIKNAAENYCIPEVEFKSKNWLVNGKRVLSINIDASKLSPHKAPDHNGNYKAYIRVADQNMLAGGVQMKIWKKLNAFDDVNLVYTDEVRMILKLITDNNMIPLPMLISQIKLSKFKIENILAELIIMKVVKMIVSFDGVLYTLADPEC